jgi:hypothetical protein
MGLSRDEFASRCPDDIDSDVREQRIATVVGGMFDAGYDMVGLVEDDNSLGLLENLNKNGEGRVIHCISQRVINAKGVNNGYVQMMKRTDGNTFAETIANPELRTAFIETMNADNKTSFTEDNLYVAEYANSIYWNPAKINIVHISPLFTELAPSETRPYKYYCGKGYNGFCQTFLKGQTEYNIMVAHLKSGEGATEEIERVTGLDSMLTSISSLANPIVLMDSNSSIHYQDDVRAEVEETVADVITRHGFCNITVQDSASDMTFKMRPGQGNQKDKLGQFMADTIDAILVRGRMCAKRMIVSGVETVDPKLLPLIYQLRNDPILRKRVSNWVINWDNGGTETELRSAGGLFEEIKNKKGKVLRKMSANESSLWGNNTTTNVYLGMAEYLGLVDGDDVALESVFNSLYPNENMPSDHPPFGAEITLIYTL